MLARIDLFFIYLLLSVFSTHAQGTRNNGSINVSDYIVANENTDIADQIQQIIDNNPNRTIYFPDGVYNLIHSIVTPADPSKSVHLVLDNYAILRASDLWNGGPMIRLGGIHPYNTINIVGSNYGIEGGVLDCNNIADGISIESGRETRVSGVSIKHANIGIYVHRGANSGSSDSDICNVNIVGNDLPTSIGILIEGYDNTFTNMRIASVNKGVVCKSQGNTFRNIHPLYIIRPSQSYQNSCGFEIEASNNFFYNCYSDQFETGFLLKKEICINLTDCFVMWYNGNVHTQNAIVNEGRFNSFVYGLHVGFSSECSTCTILQAGANGNGSIINYICNKDLLSNIDISSKYIDKKKCTKK